MRSTPLGQRALPPPPPPSCHARLRAQSPVCLLLAELFTLLACVLPGPDPSIELPAFFLRAQSACRHPERGRWRAAAPAQCCNHPPPPPPHGVLAPQSEGAPEPGAGAGRGHLPAPLLHVPRIPAQKRDSRRAHEPPVLRVGLRNTAESAVRALCRSARAGNAIGIVRPPQRGCVPHTHPAPL